MQPKISNLSERNTYIHSQGALKSQEKPSSPTLGWRGILREKILRMIIARPETYFTEFQFNLKHFQCFPPHTPPLPLWLGTVLCERELIQKNFYNVLASTCQAPYVAFNLLDNLSSREKFGQRYGPHTYYGPLHHFHFLEGLRLTGTTAMRNFPIRSSTNCSSNEFYYLYAEFQL